MARVVFLHGLESHLDARGVPIGGKARWLAAHVDVALPALDTTAAIAACRRSVAATGGWRYPFPGYDEAFATPLARAREAIGGDTELVIGSSFGGAVLLRLVHEAPRWTGPCLFLAGAGPKLTPWRELPAEQRCLLIHGTRDEVVPHADSVALAASSPRAELWSVDDDHRLKSVLGETFARAIAWCLDGRAPASGSIGHLEAE